MMKDFGPPMPRPTAKPLRHVNTPLAQFESKPDQRILLNPNLIDFDLIAKKEDVDLLRDAVLEIVAFLDTNHMPNTATVIGPACMTLRRKRKEAGK